MIMIDFKYSLVFFSLSENGENGLDGEATDGAMPLDVLG